MHEHKEREVSIIKIRKVLKKDSRTVGHLSEKTAKNTDFLSWQKNGATMDSIRLLSIWSPIITIGYSEPDPVIRYYIIQTLNLLQDHNKLREIAFSHSPKGASSRKDWLIFYKNQDACDRGRTLTPPRYGKGKEFSKQLEIINYQSTLKSLAKVNDMKMYAFSFNLTKNMIDKAEKTKDTIKSITEKLNYRLKNAFDTKIPDYYLIAEYAKVKETKSDFIKGEQRLHFHGVILLNSEDKEKAKACFKQVNPKARSIKLVEQPDILNYYPIRWGDYISKTQDETAEIMSHSLYAKGTLKKEAKHHYNKLRAFIVDHQSDGTHEVLKPRDQLKELRRKLAKSR